MGSSSGNGSRDLIAELCSAPERFGLFQAIRLLALAEGTRHIDQALPERVRFRTPATLAFPPSEIAAIRSTAGQDEEELPSLALTVACMGLTGPSGALPTHYTELLIERRQQFKDDTAHVTILKDGIATPTGIEPAGDTLWYTERGVGKVWSMELPK